MRSMLFVPGDRPERFEKAVRSGADAVIFDLEDAITSAGRPQARRNIAEYLRKVEARATSLWVRINPVDSTDVLEDLAAVMASQPDGILLPKARHGDDLQRLDHWLEAFETQHGHPVGVTKVIALVTETAQAMLSGSSFTSPPSRVTGYTWGAEDLAADVGASANRTADGDFEFVYALGRAACLLMAAAAGIAAIDTTDVEFRDLAALERRARASRCDGFVGKLAIHPAQLAPIHAAFSPSDEDIAWARRVIDAFAREPDRGAVALDGRMVDRPHLRQAERILGGLPIFHSKNGEAPLTSEERLP